MSCPQAYVIPPALLPCPPLLRMACNPTSLLCQVLHLELSTSGSSMRPLPGDSLGVVPQNEPELVAALLARLHWDGERTFSVSPAGQSGQEGGGDQPRLLQHIAWPTTLRQALTRHCEVASVPRWVPLVRSVGVQLNAWAVGCIGAAWWTGGLWDFSCYWYTLRCRAYAGMCLHVHATTKHPVPAAYAFGFAGSAGFSASHLFLHQCNDFAQTWD